MQVDDYFHLDCAYIDFKNDYMYIESRLTWYFLKLQLIQILWESGLWECNLNSEWNSIAYLIAQLISLIIIWVCYTTIHNGI